MHPILDGLNAWHQSREFAVWLPWIRLAFAFFAGVAYAMASAIQCDELLADVRAALRKAGITDKAFAADAAISAGLASIKLNGVRPLTVQTLAKLPAEFWQWFAVQLACRVGTPKEVRIGGKLRQARMTLTTQRKAGIA